MRTQDPIRVVLIEDNRMARDRLASLLDERPTLRVVATAVGAATGPASVRGVRPHVVILNAALWSGDGRPWLASAKQMAPEARVILMNVSPALDGIIAFIKAGANGIILKDATVDEFVRTIRSVADGVTVVPACVTSQLVSYIAGRVGGRTAPDGLQAVPDTTTREREVTDLIAQGFTNKEIAQRLDIATDTVKTHVHNILAKLGLHSRLEISAHANRVGRWTRIADLEGPRLMVKAG